MTLIIGASTAHAQTTQGFSSREPIEINSDELEVLQQENKAIFTGNVIAVQGDTHLKSDVMTVYYKQSGQPQQDAATAGGFGQSKVERIDVEGNVLLTTPEETASGDRGKYNVEKQIVELYSNVVLTRGENVLKGDTLVHDMATGKSVVNSPRTGAQGGRVKALFVPEKKK